MMFSFRHEQCIFCYEFVFLCLSLVSGCPFDCLVHTLLIHVLPVNERIKKIADVRQGEGKSEKGGSFQGECPFFARRAPVFAHHRDLASPTLFTSCVDFGRPSGHPRRAGSACFWPMKNSTDERLIAGRLVPAQHYARALYMHWSCACSSVCHEPKQPVRSSSSFWHRCYSAHPVFEGNSDISENKSTSFRNSVSAPNSGHHCRSIIVVSCTQLSSTEVHAQCDKLVAIVGRTIDRRYDRWPTPVYYTKRPSLCTARCAHLEYLF